MASGNIPLDKRPIAVICFVYLFPPKFWGGPFSSDEGLENLEYEFAGFLMDDDADGSDEAAELIAGLLMDLDGTTLLQLPQPVWDGLWTAIDSGAAWAEARERFCEFG